MLGATSIDLTKIFNTVSHEVLLNKLHKYGAEEI